jgi:hypothetical protein
MRGRVRFPRLLDKLLLMGSWRKLLRFRPQTLGLLDAAFGWYWLKADVLHSSSPFADSTEKQPARGFRTLRKARRDGEGHGGQVAKPSHER